MSGGKQASAYENKSVQQSHTSPQNSEAADMWKVAHHPPCRCVVAWDDYPS